MNRTLPDPLLEPTITVPRASLCAGISKDAGYDKVARGEWPALRAGRAIRVLTAKWLAAEGFTDQGAG